MQQAGDPLVVPVAPVLALAGSLSPHHGPNALGAALHACQGSFRRACNLASDPVAVPVASVLAPAPVTSALPFGLDQHCMQGRENIMGERNYPLDCPMSQFLELAEERLQ